MPAVSLPLHWTDDGLPVGVMLAARPAEEELLLSLSAAQVEAAQAGTVPWAGQAPARLVRRGWQSSPIPRACSASPVSRARATTRMTKGIDAPGANARARGPRAASRDSSASSDRRRDRPQHQRERERHLLGVDAHPAQRAETARDRVHHLVDRRRDGQRGGEQDQRDQVADDLDSARPAVLPDRPGAEDRGGDQQPRASPAG